jgi:hypothetical protein
MFHARTWTTSVDGRDVGADGATLDTAVANIATNTSALSAIGGRDLAGGYPGLDDSGLLKTEQFPLIAIGEVFLVGNEAEQLALTAQKGDLAVRTDENKSYCNNGGLAGTIADWTLLRTPVDLVLSVSGTTNQVIANQTTGAITLSLPQDIATTSNPSFASVYCTNIAGNRLVQTGGASKVTDADLTEFFLGTANQVVTTDNGDGTISLSTPQDLATGSNVNFGNLTLGGLSANRIVATDGTGTLQSVGLINWISGTTNQIIADGTSTVSLSLPQDLDVNADFQVRTTDQRCAYFPVVIQLEIQLVSFLTMVLIRAI